MVRRLLEEQLERVYKAHRMGLPLDKASEYAGTTNATVLKYWRLRGLRPNFGRRWRSLKRDQIERIHEAHRLGMNNIEASRYAGVSSATICKYWKKAKLKPPHGNRDRLTKEKINRIYEAHRLGLSINLAAEQAGVGKRTIITYWKHKNLEPHYKSGPNPKRQYDFGYGPIDFDSMPERAIGILLNRYGLVKKFREGKNLHVKTNGNGHHSIDFLVGKTFIEFHPKSILEAKRGLTLEEAGERKRENITKPEYQGFWFWHLWEIDQMYDILKDPEISKLIRKEHKPLTRRRFDEQLRRSYEAAAGYDTRSIKA
ncbi:MAG: hypothetical protein KKD18_06310 [Nanoarchaeota archaeon]|nr:hypothetical protein [Nanoarchaeota archaeon]MBU0978006.1 hypothetical protein [Nanoarchaeota archaeon]